VRRPRTETLGLLAPLLGVASLFVASQFRHATLPWLILSPTHDARSPEMARFDEQMDEHLVTRLNETPEFRGRLQVSHRGVASILESGAPFASLHFDPTKSMALSEEEKRAVEEYMIRGGFLLLVEDNYPYFEWQYRAKTEGTLFDFFARELPQRNPEFSTGRAGPGHPLFTQHYRIEIPPLIQQEMDENSHYRGETLFLHEGRLAGYTLSLFAFHDGDEHVPLRPPYRPYDLILSGHELLVNIYLYTSRH